MRRFLRSIQKIRQANTTQAVYSHDRHEKKRIGNGDRKKSVFILGANGVIGKLLADGLAAEYQVLLSDVSDTDQLPDNYFNVDIRDYESLISAIPKTIDVVINLAGLPARPEIVDEHDVKALSDIYICGSYNVFLAAQRLKIQRVIFASTNHVTGRYESHGISALNRTISVNDLPSPDSVYGAMKYCAELFGELFSEKKGLSVISLRIGTVRADEVEFLTKNERSRRTLLSNDDTVSLFRAAIETELKSGVFYGVSDNPGRPWDIDHAIQELGFRPGTNSNDLTSNSDGR